MIKFFRHIRKSILKGRAQDKAILNMITDNEVSTALNLTKEDLKSILAKVISGTEEILDEDKVVGLK